MRILIADRDPPFLDALKKALATLQPNAWIERAGSFGTLIDHLGSAGFELVITTLDLPGINGLTDIIDLINLAGKSKIVVAADGHGLDIHRQIRVCGIAGLLEKSESTDHIIRVIGMVLRGGLAFPEILAVPAAGSVPVAHPELTSRQIKVLAQMTKGKSNKQIAKDLTLSPNTVKAHVSEILRKLGVASRAEVIALAHQPLKLRQAAD